MRHRPRFPAGWQLVFHIEFDDTGWIAANC